MKDKICARLEILIEANKEITEKLYKQIYNICVKELGFDKFTSEYIKEMKDNLDITLKFTSNQVYKGDE